MRDFFRASIAKNREGEGRANPLFPAPKMPRWKRLFFASALFGVPFGSGYFGVHLLSQPQFIISNIEITGTACLDQGVVKKEIENALSERTMIFFSRANKILFSPQKLADELTRDLPIDHADIVVDGNTLHVAVQEDVVMVLFHSGNDWLLSDLSGAILRSLTADEILLLDSPPATNVEMLQLPFNKIPKILLSESVSTDLKDPIYPKQRLETLSELDKGLRSVGLTPDRYLLETRKDTWLAVTTKEKPYSIYFELENPIPPQIKILSSILSEHQEIPGMAYVDLRFGNRVYMK